MEIACNVKRVNFLRRLMRNSSESRNSVFVPPPYSILQFNNANIICKDFSERNKMIPFYVVTVFLVCYNRKNT